MHRQQSILGEHETVFSLYQERPSLPGEASPVANPTHFKPEEVLENIEQDRELLGEMVEIFLETLPSQLDDLKAAWREGALDRVAGAAHSLKGSLLTLSAGPGSELASRLEKAGRAQDADTVQALMPEFERELEELCQELSAFSPS